jgi:hypothetical protein
MRRIVQGRQWVEKQAARYATPEAIRRRIAYEEKQILTLKSFSLSSTVTKALENHEELIRVLTERLAGFDPKTL